jgi:hypothetical protein
MVRPTSAISEDVLHVRTTDVWMGVVSTKSPNGVKRGGFLGLLLADIVAKVENRTTRKISRKSIFRRSYCRKALWGQYESRWSFWYETMWSLMSPRAKRISGPKKSRSSAKKDFCNKIGAKQPFTLKIGGR